MSRSCAARTAFNEAQRRLARRAPPAEQSDEALERVVDSRPATHAAVEQRELARALDHALRRLAPELRAPVLLRDVEGRCTSEAAAILDLNAAALKSRLPIAEGVYRAVGFRDLGRYLEYVPNG